MQKIPEWGRWVSTMRQMRKLTKKQLAEEACMHESFIGLIERDGRVPSYEVTERIGRVFGCTETTLMMSGKIPVDKIQFYLMLRSQHHEKSMDHGEARKHKARQSPDRLRPPNERPVQTDGRRSQSPAAGPGAKRFTGHPL